MLGGPRAFSLRRFVGRSRSHGYKLDGLHWNVRSPARFVIDDFGRFDTATGGVSLSKGFVPGHFPMVHCGAIRGKTLLTLPIRSRSTCDDSSILESAISPWLANRPSAIVELPANVRKSRPGAARGIACPAIGRSLRWLRRSLRGERCEGSNRLDGAQKNRAMPGSRDPYRSRYSSLGHVWKGGPWGFGKNPGNSRGDIAQERGMFPQGMGIRCLRILTCHHPCVLLRVLFILSERNVGADSWKRGRFG